MIETMEDWHVCQTKKTPNFLFYKNRDFTWGVSDCEELVRPITVIKSLSSKAVELIYGSKGDMSRRKSLKRTARKKRKSG